MSDQTAPSAPDLVARNFSALFAGQLVYRVLAIVFNIYVVRTLGEAALGRYAAALAYVMLFAILTDLGLNPWAVREMARRREVTAALIGNLMAVRTVLSLLLIAALTLSVAVVPARALEPATVFIAGLSLLFYAWSGPLDAVLIAWERMEITSLLVVIKQTIYIVVGFVLLSAGLQHIGLLTANVASVAGVALLSHIIVWRVLKIRLTRPTPARWPAMLRAGLPFGITGAAAQLTEQFDTVLMAFLLTADQVGRYAAPYNLLMMIVVLPAMLGTAVFPQMVREAGGPPATLARTVARIWRLLLLPALPLAVGGVLLSDRLVLALYGEAFRGSVPVLRVLLLTLPLIFSAELLRRLADALGHERHNARLGIVLTVVSVLLNVLLINAIGILGAALAYVAMRSVQFVGLLWIVRGLQPLRILLGVLSRLLLPLAALAGAVALASRQWGGARSDMIALLTIVAGGGALFLAAAVLTGGITRPEVAWVGRRLLPARFRPTG